MSEISNDSVFLIDDGMDTTRNQDLLKQSAVNKKSNFFVKTILNKVDRDTRVMNVLMEGNDISVHPQFRDYVANMDQEGGLVVVSVVGPKGAGKSFLTDSLITNESGVLYRGMSEVQKSIANSPKYHYFTKNNSRVQFIDVRDDISNENFLFLYFLSSVIIFNVKDGDQKAQNEYLKKFKFVNKKLYFQEEDDLSQPRLIFVRRDADEKRISEEDSQREFRQKVEECEIFGDNMISLAVPFPAENAKPKQLPDLPLTGFKPSFKDSIKSLSKIIYGSQPKIFKGNYVNSKILTYSLNPVLNQINEKNKLQSGKIWADIIENYSKDYYDLYTSNYSQQIVNGFENKKQMNEVELNQILSKAKRQTDKKYRAFKNLENDMTFRRYNVMVNNYVQDEEQKYRKINRDKIFFHNQENGKDLLHNLSPNNYIKVIDEYNNDPAGFQYKKSDILIDNFHLLLQNSMGEYDFGERGKSGKVLFYQNELKDLQQQITQQKKTRENEPQIYILETRVKQKETQLKNLHQSLLQKYNKSNSDAIQLQKQLDNIKERIDQENKQIDNLQNKKQRKISDSILVLQNQLKDQKDNLHKYHSHMRSGVRVKQAHVQGKDVMCSLM